MSTFCRDKTVHKINKKSALDKSCELKIIYMFVKKINAFVYAVLYIADPRFCKMLACTCTIFKKKLLHFSFTFSYYIIFKCL